VKLSPEQVSMVNSCFINEYDDDDDDDDGFVKPVSDSEVERIIPPNPKPVSVRFQLSTNRICP